MQTLHLFAGAGGGLLADLILGHTPIGAVEFDPYCCAVLRERAADGWFPELCVHKGDVRLFDPSEYTGRVDCLHAGFPCQPHSVAGKREGEADERNLWPDTKRIIGELRPRFALLENVPGIFATGYAWTVLGDLAALGYDARWAIISAADAGAPHRRDRWWCLAERADALCEVLADASGRRCSGPETRKMEQPRRAEVISASEIVADPISNRLQRFSGGGISETPLAGKRSRGEAAGGNGEARGYWKTEPSVGRVVDWVAYGMDMFEWGPRIKAIGNGQVSITAALAWRILGGP